MKLGNIPVQLDGPVRALLGCLRKLKMTQGRVARMNARRSVRARLNRINNVMNTAFPVIPKLQTIGDFVSEVGRRKGLTPSQRGARFTQRMKRRDYAPVPDRNLREAILKAGVRIIDPPLRSDVVPPYAPRWAILGALHQHGSRGYNVAQVRILRKSISKRRVFLAAQRLGAPFPVNQFQKNTESFVQHGSLRPISRVNK